jgi:eukaryotic-like serine/threonine-protein kinase
VPATAPSTRNGNALQRKEGAAEATHPADSAGAGRQGASADDAEARGATTRRMPSARNTERATASDAPSDVAIRGHTGTKRKIAIIAGAAIAAALGVIAAVVLSASGGAKLVVTVSPTDGAAISVNGTPASAGESLDLEPGSHEIEASAPGRQVEKRVVTLAEGENTPVHFELGPMSEAREPPREASERSKTAGTFTARFVTKVPSVEIHIGDDLVGATPGAVASNLEVGKTYRFIARKKGFKPYEGEFVATSAGELEVAVPLVEEPQPTMVVAQTGRDAIKRVGIQGRRRGVTGWLACSTRPAGAEVFVDGKPTGRVTPVALGNPVVVTAGNRVIQFKMEGKKSVPRTVEIKEGEVARLVNVPLE